MSRRALLVLMWKHLIVRKRRYFHTFVDFAMPILFFCLMYRFRAYIKPPLPKAVVAEGYNSITHYPDVQPLSRLPLPRRILYYPPNKLTDALMDEIGRKLNIKRLELLPSHSGKERNLKGYYAIEDMTEVTKYLSEMFSNEAIVLFHNLEGDEWPSQLSYTIRLKQMFHTNTYIPSSGQTRPHRQFGEAYEEFVHLQWTIDTSFIKVVTNNDVNKTISMQEFPYTGTNANERAKSVCSIIAALVFMSCFLPFVFLMSRLIEQRSTGVQELIKMVGATSNMIGISHFLNVLPVGLVFSITTTILLKAGYNPLVEFSDGSAIFIVLILHYISIICMAFAMSFVDSTQYSISISIFAYILVWLPSRLLGEVRPPRILVPLTGIFPNVPLNWFWDEVATFEMYGNGFQWSDAAKSHTSKTGCVGLALFWLLFQIAVFSFLAWYLSKVRPGPHGVPLPWDFLFKKSYWNKNEVTPHVEWMDEQEENFVTEEKYFETPPKHLDVGIRINNVSKVFPQHRALSNVSLNVYRGEICVLLGHNGAGKTTLMSIITGMMVPTEGTVYVNGMDTRRDRDKISKEIGLCPQHNIFFADLTVLEHAMFFTMLKHGTYREARTSGLALLKELGLADKANTRSGALSGGMKRRLQLACALAGGADVLVLDEPTAGLDVETRRSLWDLLLSLRGSRTVLLSTHFMEEADALGDRVAALHQGRLRCCATTLHLKKSIGTGYRLSLTTAGTPREEAVSEIVFSHVPDAYLSQKTVNSLAYNLPSASSERFPVLFTSLEDLKSELGIESIGVGVSTLEEVFLTLCSDTDINMTDDEIDSRYVEPNYHKIRGFPLYWRTFLVLLKRQFKFCLAKRITFIVLQVLMPMVMIFIFTATSNNDAQDDKNIDLPLRLDMYKSIPDPRVLVNVHDNGADIGILEKEYPKFKFKRLDSDLAEGILRTGKKDILEYNKYLAGIELNETDAKVLYTSLVRHAAPVAMNLLTNLLAAEYLPKATGHTITVSNHPIESVVAFDTRKEIVHPKMQEQCFTWSILIVFVSLASLVNLAVLPCRERVSGSRHIQQMAGCPVSLHWCSTLLAHLVLSIITLGFTLLIALLLLDRDSTFNNAGTVGCVMVMLFFGVLAFLSSMYIVTFWFGEQMTGVFLVGCLLIFGLITPTLFELISHEGDSVSWKSMMMQLVSWVAPPHTFTVGILHTMSVARINAYCHLNRDMCPGLAVQEPGFNSEVCCNGGLPQCYFCWEDYAPTHLMIRLIVQFVVFMVIVVLLQEGVICRWYECIFNRFYKPQPFTETDDMVRAESAYVDKQIRLGTKQLQNSGISMLAHKLHKNYRKLCKSHAAVKGISFSVKKGECFGLLGVNGAGKSTTFKMLTVEECKTRGKLYGNGYHAETNRIKYIQTLGYCPQFFGLDDFLTARENLTLLLTCRGLDAEETEKEVKSWIAVVGLEKYADRAVSGYSGGMARRLGAAAALGVGGRLVLLDEPTAGVDVAARRRVWAALRRAAPSKRSVLLTSHSMDEMEALCDRIAIMSAGRIRALGTAHELRARHALGHAVILKLYHIEYDHLDQVDGAKAAINMLKTDFNDKFNCVIKDEHITMLHYHINETLHYSSLFHEMEQLKAKYPDLLEDYSITETTLEEVFLSFAKEQSEEQTPNNAPNRIV